MYWSVHSNKQLNKLDLSLQSSVEKGLNNSLNKSTCKERITYKVYQKPRKLLRMSIVRILMASSKLDQRELELLTKYLLSEHL